jgi:hypothetical protein
VQNPSPSATTARCSSVMRSSGSTTSSVCCDLRGRVDAAER